MEITKSQASMLAQLAICIEEKLGISIGYTCEFGTFVNDSSDFILDDVQMTEEFADRIGIPYVEKSPQLYYKADYQKYGDGILVREEPAQYPLHDDKVIAFLNQVNQALEDGIIYFDPEITRTVEGREFKVSKLANGKYSIKYSSYPGWTSSFHAEKDEIEKKLDFKTDLPIILDIIQELG